MDYFGLTCDISVLQAAFTAPYDIFFIYLSQDWHKILQKIVISSNIKKGVSCNVQSLDANMKYNDYKISLEP